VAALDDWAAARRAASKGNDKAWQHLVAVARAADADGWRNRLREAWQRSDRKLLVEMAGKAEAAQQAPATVVLLADALANAGASAEAVAVLQKVWKAYPDDFWVNHQLASYLQQLRPVRTEEALRYYTAAVALRPRNPGVFLNMGNALAARNQLKEAVDLYRKAIQLQPEYAQAHVSLGAALLAQGQFEEGVVCFRQAIALRSEEHT